ncbi:MAG: acyltransferase [Bacilli bacterium]|nr:acyltransferase [Bacilli bacterium]
MFVLKIYYHMLSIIKKCFYKFIYGRNINFGKKVQFRKGFSINIDSSQSNVIIGDNTFFNNYCTISCMSGVEIGKNTLFGENVKIYDNNHIFNVANKTIKEQGYSSSKIKIGNNCWIANNVIILKGVNIGDNVVIAAGCIIKEDIESNMIVKSNNELIKEKIIYRS